MVVAMTGVVVALKVVTTGLWWWWWWWRVAPDDRSRRRSVCITVPLLHQRSRHLRSSSNGKRGADACLSMHPSFAATATGSQKQLRHD
jgi:hypothetical protein